MAVSAAAPDLAHTGTAGVDILSSGDTVSELFLLLSGTVEVISPDPAATTQPSAHVAPQGDALAQASHSCSVYHKPASWHTSSLMPHQPDAALCSPVPSCLLAVTL